MKNRFVHLLKKLKTPFVWLLMVLSMGIPFILLVNTNPFPIYQTLGEVPTIFWIYFSMIFVIGVLFTVILYIFTIKEKSKKAAIKLILSVLLIVCFAAHIFVVSLAYGLHVTPPADDTLTELVGYTGRLLHKSNLVSQYEFIGSAILFGLFVLELFIIKKIDKVKKNS